MSRVPLLAAVAENWLDAYAGENHPAPGDATTRVGVPAHEFAAAAGNVVGGGEKPKQPASPQESAGKKTCARTHEGRCARERTDLDSEWEADDVGFDDSNTAPRDDDSNTAPRDDGLKDATAAGHGRGDTATVVPDGRGDMATAASNGLHGSISEEANGAGDKSPEGKRGDLSDVLPPPKSDKKPKESGLSPIEILYVESLKFAHDAAHSSMALEAMNFLRAVEDLYAGKDIKKRKVKDTQLSKTGRLLTDAARRAPTTEATLSAVAIKISGESSLILLSLEDQPSGPCDFCSRWSERLRAVVWAPEPTLPLHHIRERQEKLSVKRQTLFGVALAAPVALLTSAAAMKTEVSPSAFIPWIVVISAVLWILVSCGVVMDLHGKTNFEFGFASCLSRLGMMGVTVLFCLFIFGALLPSSTVWMWLLVGFAVAVHTFLCFVRRTSAVDQTFTTSNSEAIEMRSKCCGCNCNCRLDV